MSSFAFLNFFVGLTSLDFELFWCLMLFVLFCCLTSLVLCTLSKKCVRLLTFFYWNFFVPFLLLLSSSFCLYVLCFHGIISDIAITPFSDSYFDWQNTYTIVKLPNIELLIAAGDVKEKKEDLKKIARESSRPGVDHRFMFAPLKVRSFDVSV